MRPLRFLITLVSFIVAFFLLLFVGPWRGKPSIRDSEEENGSIGTYFNWRTPSSLFPPSAIISLTDDNSTNFVARPAAFGPLLPAKSLSGQLWIGSGFGDDHLGGEGELGCSDVPGWDDGSWTASSSASSRKVFSDGKGATADSPLSGSNKSKRSLVEDEDELEEDEEQHPSENDGTDDYLHHPLPASDGLKTNGEAAGNTKKPTHADIQSLQESAEIAGKIVLLSRGGCGFLEKVKWVQRRGGIALIVGDDIRGGQLVTMYARGDTSNVTIPSLFTSHTTAQLLSSLMPSDGFSYPDQRPALGGKGKQKQDDSRGGKQHDADKPFFTTTTATAKATPTPKPKQAVDDRKLAKEADKEQDQKPCGWLSGLLKGCTDNGRDSRRPPSSGKNGWIQQEEFDDDDYVRAKNGKLLSTSSSSSISPTSTPKKAPSDGFQIGVQDWRDPDLVAEQKEQQMRASSSPVSSSTATSSRSSATAAPTSLKGGSITPGSGEYAKANHEAVDISSAQKSQSREGVISQQTSSDQQDSSRSWLGRLLRSDAGKAAKAEPASQIDTTKASELDFHRKSDSSHRQRPSSDGRQVHHGLWVTLSPTSMSTSPFFDTLLVLVVSPLVTLTVVYALLLLRSRIRRRRWRAPKSVVERLPVRTYQTMPSSTTSSSTSSIASPNVTTPLLPSATRPISTRSRPRARTASEIAQGSSMRSDDMASPSLDQIEEKRAAGLAEWRRRYGGKQRECVVCLEEYVDGVSRVMSLPCGHEFHAECITPWLTTRRRTCPICKGDVVRSLARSAGTPSSSTPPQRYRDESEEEEEDVQEQAVTTINEDPAAQRPVSREDEAFEDLERGVNLTPPPREEPDRNR
ncbi:related to PA and RING finger domain [Lecanosticta acicola]|uniref:RING-type E3 ubiquitin transferase n=1 Tax=Lecanosticta acicola TaxID=111012 RepID=A0AAI8W291_9PEZI|nr:related to PA and RING finger domain [Lecanosticta acicola]